MKVQLLCGLGYYNDSVNSIVAVCVSTIMKSFWPKYWGGSSPSRPPSYAPSEGSGPSCRRDHWDPSIKEKSISYIILAAVLSYPGTYFLFIITKILRSKPS